MLDSQRQYFKNETLEWIRQNKEKPNRVALQTQSVNCPPLIESAIFDKTLFEQVEEDNKRCMGVHTIPFTNINICGKDFKDVPSLDWLAAAVKEKLDRENGKLDELVKVMRCDQCTHYAKLLFANRGLCIRNDNAVWSNDYCSYACTHEELLE